MDIEVKSLTKRYPGGALALDKLDLHVPTGMFGLLGSNGAGKTTLMRILAGVLPPTGGSVKIGPYDLFDDEDKVEIQQRLGYLPQELGVYPELSAREFLDYIAILKGLDNPSRRRRRVEEVLDLVSLAKVASRRLGGYSGGMKRRVGIAQALLTDPALLIVDEPTAGLDPEERVRFRMLLASLGGQRTVVLSTHIVEDVASTCRLCAVMGHGHLLYRGEVQGLAREAESMVWTVETAEPVSDIAGGVVVSAVQLEDRSVYRIVAEQPPRPNAVRVEPGLEEGYLALVARDRRNLRSAEASASVQSPDRGRPKQTRRPSRAPSEEPPRPPRPAAQPRSFRIVESPGSGAADRR